MDLKLKDKVAFITGATNEIGREVCLNLVREGAKLLFSDINTQKGEDLAKEIADMGGEAVFSKVDVRDYEEVKDNIIKAKDQFGRLDIVIYMAGVGGRPKRFIETSPEDWKQYVEILLLGMVNTTGRPLSRSASSNCPTCHSVCSYSKVTG